MELTKQKILQFNILHFSMFLWNVIRFLTFYINIDQYLPKKIHTPMYTYMHALDIFRFKKKFILLKKQTNMENYCVNCFICLHLFLITFMLQELLKVSSVATYLKGQTIGVSTEFLHFCII